MRLPCARVLLENATGVQIARFLQLVQVAAANSLVNTDVVTVTDKQQDCPSFFRGILSPQLGIRIFLFFTFRHSSKVTISKLLVNVLAA